MKKISDLVPATGTTKRQSDSLGFNHTNEGMAKAWRALIAMKLQFQEVGSTDFMYWHHGLREFSDQDLDRGVKKALEWKCKAIDFTLGVFRDLCKPEAVKACHEPYEALPRMKASKETRQKYMNKIREMFDERSADC